MKNTILLFISVFLAQAMAQGHKGGSLFCEIVYDVPPPKYLGKASLKISNASMEKIIADGCSVPSGEYRLQITLAGYFPVEKIIHVLPGQIFRIEETLYAKPRKLHYELLPPFHWILDDTCTWRHMGVYQISIDGKIGSPGPLPVGKSYKLVFKFYKLKTVEKTISIPPGEGPYPIDIPLVELKKCRILIPSRFDINEKGTVVLDGKAYTLKIFSDEHPVAPHHIGVEIWNDKYRLVTFRTLKRMPRIRLELGYYFMNASICEGSGEPGSVKYDCVKYGICVERLIEHMKGLSASRLSEVIERLCWDPQEKYMIRRLPRQERDKLLDYIQVSDNGSCGR